MPDLPDDALPSDEQELAAVPLAYDDGIDISDEDAPVRPESGSVPATPPEA